MTPKLRFSEFKGEWKRFLLKDIVEIKAGGDLPPFWSKEKNDECKFPIFSNSLENYGLYGYSKLPKITAKESVTVTGRGSVGIPVFRKGAYTPIVRLLTLIPKNSYETDCKFLELAIQSIHIFIESTGVPQLTSPQIGAYRIVLTEYKEQQKIASLFRAVEQKINLLIKKKEALETYKRGLMQKIFSQELRFKREDGSDYPEWEKMKLGEVFKNIGGTALENHFSDEGTHSVISIGNYRINGKYYDNGQRILLNEKTQTKLLEKDNLVMVLNDKTKTGDIIGSTILIEENNIYIYNQRSERLICNTSILSPKYAWTFLNSKKFRRLIFSISQGGTQIYVNFSAVKKLSFPVPCIEEQKKIANHLFTIDTKIDLVDAQIENAQTFKKGLLHQMFV